MIVGTGWYASIAGSAFLFDTATGQQTYRLDQESGILGASFGTSVGVSGTTAIVGAPNVSTRGQVYLFDTTTGQQFAELISSDGVAGDSFGWSVAVSGNVAIVGASSLGAAYLFDTQTGNQMYKLAAGGIGGSVGISGTTAIAGAPGDDGDVVGSGAAYLFDVITGQKIHKLIPNDGIAAGGFGHSVAISGTTAIVAAYHDAAGYDGSGTAYLFDITTGQQIAKLVPSVVGEPSGFGNSIAISGTRAIVGAWGESGGIGSAYVFDSSTGTQLDRLIPNDSGTVSNFGRIVAVTETTVIASGFSFEGNATLGSVGAVYFSCPPPQIVDLNDDHFRWDVGESIEFTTDKELLANGGRPVEGIAADGITPILLRYIIPGVSSDSTQELEITLKDDGGSIDPIRVGKLCTASQPVQRCGNPLRVPIDEVEAGSEAFATITAPMDFTRSVDDTSQTERILTVESRFVVHGVLECTPRIRDITLVRPPVLLVHGLWGEAVTWTWNLISNPKFVVWRYDYSSTNDQAFAINLPRIRLGAEMTRFIRNFASDIPIASTQVDIFGHSMGGRLARLFAETHDGEYRRKDNFFSGDFHKLVLVNVPNFGSKLAPVLVSPTNQISFIGRLFSLLTGDCVDCGAVADLRPDNPVNCDQGEIFVRSHVMQSTEPDTSLHSAVLNILAFIGGQWSLGSIFHEPNDLLVGITSQLGGLADGFQTGFVGGDHMAATDRGDYGQRAIELLDARIDDGFFVDYLPAHSSCNVLGSRRTPSNDTATETLSILSPESGSIVAPGEEVVVTLAPNTGDPLVRAILVANNIAVEMVGTPRQTTVIVPNDVIGNWAVTAAAVSESDQLLLSQPLRLVVEPLAMITRLEVVPNPVGLTVYAPETRLTSFGHFDDGVLRALSGGVVPLVYRVEDPAIAGVAADGTVTAKNVGETTLTITTETGVSHDVRVFVLSVAFDSNLDAVIDLADWQGFAGCMAGPFGQTSRDMPSIECRDFFDHDRDTDVDLIDYASFQVGFSAPK